MDKISPERRSENMRSIRSYDTAPELFVRKLVHKLGFRFRLRQKDLPGKPDLVFPRRQKVVFVHGCFWHQHAGCFDAHIPKSNKSYWIPKLKRTQIRDHDNRNKLKRLRWKSMIIWACELHHVETIEKRLKKFLSAS